MAALLERDPDWVDAILDWRWTWVLARIGLTSAFFLGGVMKLADLPAAVAEQEHFGLYPAELWAGLAIAVEIVAPLLVIFGRLVWLGAGAMGCLTAIAMFVANDFWNRSGADGFAALNGFFEHLGLIAGLVLAAVLAEHDSRRHQPRAASMIGRLM